MTMQYDGEPPMPADTAKAIAVAHHHGLQRQSYQGASDAWCPGCGQRVQALYTGERDGGRFNWEARCGLCLYRIAGGDTE
jgi:hypothetical protein